MVAAVDPYRTALDENINVLRFTSLARQIKTNYTLPHSPSILTPSTEAPHYSLPTRSGRHPVGPSIAKPLERITRHASSSSTAEAIEADPADESLVSFIDEEDVNDDAEGSEEEDPLVNSLFEEIRQLRQEAVQKELDFEMALHRIRQEERDRYSAKVEEVRQQLIADAEYQVCQLCWVSKSCTGGESLIIWMLKLQRELMEDLMDRKIDNMKVSYDKMVGLLQEQLRLATEAASGATPEDSVELDDESADNSEEVSEDRSGHSRSPVRKPLAPSMPSAFRQVATSVSRTVDSKDLSDSNSTRKSSRLSRASLSIDSESENLLRTSASNGRR